MYITTTSTQLLYTLPIKNKKVEKIIIAIGPPYCTCSCDHYSLSEIIFSSILHHHVHLMYLVAYVIANKYLKVIHISEDVCFN